VTIAVAILVSGFVSLTLTPMLAARFLTSGTVEHGIRHGWLYNLIERAFEGVLGVYKWTLRLALRARLVVLLLSVGVLVATGYLFNLIPKGFLPSEDQGRIFIQTEAAEGTSYGAMVRYQTALADIVAADPDVESFMISIGARGGQATGTNTGVLFLKLRDRKTRTRSVDQFIQDLRPKLAQVPGVRAYLQNPPTIRIAGPAHT